MMRTIFDDDAVRRTEEIVADYSIRKTSDSRYMKRGLLACGWLIVLGLIYVASIGPMAFLESQGFGTDVTWNRLQTTIYGPDYFAWWYGPNWVSSPLSAYVGLFEVGESIAENLGAEHNDLLHELVIHKRAFSKRELVQGEWDKEHPDEAKIRRDSLAGCFCCHDPLSKEELMEAENSWWWSTVR